MLVNKQKYGLQMFDKCWFLCLALLGPMSASAASSNFASLELLELSMNEFKNFAGEIGHRFDNEYQVRLTVIDIRLTERHLSSNVEAVAIDGDNVEGIFRGNELHFDRYFTNSWYASLSVGHYADIYRHQILKDQAVENKTYTVGTGFGYLKQNPFGIKHSYINFNMPFRYYFDSIDETMLGDTTVREHLIVGNIWLFVGFYF